MTAFDVTVPSNEFATLLSRAQGIVNQRSPIPMLACVLLRAEGTALQIVASDLYLGITSAMAAEVREPGTIALPMRELAERVKAMPAGPIHIRVDDKLGAVMKSKVGNRRYVLKGAPADDYPNIPTPSNDAPCLSLATKTLAELLERTHFAALSEDADGAAPQMTSVFIEWEGETILAFATDTRRLALFKMKTPGRLGSLRMMLGGKAVRELRRHCADSFADEGELSLILSGSNAFFSGNGVTLSAATVAADPFPFKNAIAAVAAPKTTARVGKKPLLDAIRGVAIAADDSFIHVEVGGNVIRIDTKSDKGGESDDHVPAETSGPKVTFGASSNYMIDAVEAITGDEVLIGVDGEKDPVRVLPVDKADDYLGIVMPRLK